MKGREFFVIGIGLFDNYELGRRVVELQERIGEELRYDILKRKAFTDPGNLHITLLKTNALGPEEIEKVENAFEECCRSLQRDLGYNPLVLTVGGVGEFHNTVLFAHVEAEQASRLTEMAGVFRAKFDALGFPVDDHIYHPHMTISSKFRVINPVTMRRMALYPWNWWDELQRYQFGTHRVEKLYLLRRSEYIGHHTYQVQKSYFIPLCDSLDDGFCSLLWRIIGWWGRKFLGRDVWIWSMLLIPLGIKFKSYYCARLH